MPQKGNDATMMPFCGCFAGNRLMVSVSKGNSARTGAADEYGMEEFIMKKNRMQISTLLTLLLCMLLLTACGASAAESEGTDPETPPQESAAAPETEEPSAQQEDVTLEELLGEDYVNYLTETITMQMANRMDKDPEVRYFPIEDNTPLSDYVTIGGTTKFEVDEEGNPVIYFPAGTVTDEANGEQSFRIPKLYQ